MVMVWVGVVVHSLHVSHLGSRFLGHADSNSRVAFRLEAIIAKLLTLTTFP